MSTLTYIILSVKLSTSIIHTIKYSPQKYLNVLNILIK